MADLSKHAEQLKRASYTKNTQEIYDSAYDLYIEFLDVHKLNDESTGQKLEHFVAFLSKANYPSKTITTYLAGVKTNIRSFCFMAFPFLLHFSNAHGSLVH